MQLRFISRGLLIGIIACAIIGWSLLSIPPTQAEEPSSVGRNPCGSDVEQFVYLSEAKNPIRHSRPSRHSREGGNPLLEDAVTVGQNPRRGFDMEPQGRVLSPAIGGTKNPTFADSNQINPATPAPSPADTGCYVLRGDMDHSGAHDIADLTYLVGYLFGGGLPPVCAEEGDVDASGELDIADLTYFVAYLFLGGPAPPIPQGKDYSVPHQNGGYTLLTETSGLTDASCQCPTLLFLHETETFRS